MSRWHHGYASTVYAPCYADLQIGSDQDTNVEGDWDTVFAAIKRCHETLHEMDVPRIATTIKLGTRVDREQKMIDKVWSVKAKMAEG